MKRSPSILICLLTCLLTALWLAGAARPLSAAVPEAEVSGTVVSFDTTQGLLSVNTRLGVQQFSVTGTTVYLLNNHSTTQNSVTVDERVSVTYVVNTGTATIVHLFSETRAVVRVVSVADTAIGVRLNGAVVSLVPDTNSVVELAGVPLKDRTILVNRTATVIYEPTGLKLLSLSATAPIRAGRITAIDTTANTLTVTGRVKRTYLVSAKATLLRNGHTSALTAFKTGDRVRVAYAGSGKTLRVLVMRTL